MMTPSHAQAVASRFEDMLTGAPLEDHVWVWIQNFPISLLAADRNWDQFIKEESLASPGAWGQDFISAVLTEELSDLPLVLAAVMPEDDLAPVSAASPRAWLNIWDGNHRLAAWFSRLSPSQIKKIQLPVALGIPRTMALENLPDEIQTLPEVANALTRRPDRHCPPRLS